MKKIFFVFSIIILLITFFCLLQKRIIENINTIYVSNTAIKVEVANTKEKQYKGLSGKNNLCENCGMLFIFPDKTERTFVMREMLFPIDIIWISGGKIVKIDESLKQEKLENITQYKSGTEIDMVLEVNAGFAKKNNFRVGDSITTK